TNGAASFAASTRQWRRVARAARSPSQNRRRESRTYQFESSSTYAAIARPPPVQSYDSIRSITSAIVACRRDRAQRSRSVRPADCGLVEILPAEALGVGVEHEERVRVPEREQELAYRLADRVGREAVAGPWLLRRQVVPAKRVGPVPADDLPRIDDVSEALRHL